MNFCQCAGPGGYGGGVVERAQTHHEVPEFDLITEFAVHSCLWKRHVELVNALEARAECLPFSRGICDSRASLCFPDVHE